MHEPAHREKLIGDEIAFIEAHSKAAVAGESGFPGSNYLGSN
jgi:hypothetical protein